jgi:hypothetical protein
LGNPALVTVLHFQECIVKGGKQELGLQWLGEAQSLPLGEKELFYIFVNGHPLFCFKPAEDIGLADSHIVIF